MLKQNEYLSELQIIAEPDIVSMNCAPFHFVGKELPDTAVTGIEGQEPVAHFIEKKGMISSSRR